MYLDIIDTLGLFPELQTKLQEYARLRKEAIDAARGLTESTPTEQQHSEQEAHHDVVTVASIIKAMPRTQLEATVVDAILDKKISMDDIIRKLQPTV